MSDHDYLCCWCGSIEICRHCALPAADCNFYPGELWDPYCPNLRCRPEDELRWQLLVEFDTPTEAECYYEEVRGRWGSSVGIEQSDTVTVATSSQIDSLDEPVRYLLRTLSPRQVSLTRSAT